MKSPLLRRASARADALAPLIAPGVTTSVAEWPWQRRSRRSPFAKPSSAPASGRVRRLLWPVAAFGLTPLLAGEPIAAPAEASARGSVFRGWREYQGWSRTAGERTGEQVWTSPEVNAPGGWHELVASWNARTPPGSGLKIEARALRADESTKFYCLGAWSSAPSRHPRASVPGQADAEAEVETDTLVLKRPAERAQVRVRLTCSPEGRAPTLKFVGVSCVNTRSEPDALSPNRRAWGRVIAVPERSQAAYPGGAQEWCSPTCVSMVLAHWSRVLRKPELDRDVPEVVEGVFDPKWPGTGNWPFNTAYAGSLPGLRAYVTRLTDVSELEDWVARDIPVVISVCYDLLRGRPRDRASGHLVVCVGFTESGEVVVNDPGTREHVRKTFARENLIRAWANSKNTVYLIYPEDWRPPRDRFGHWFDSGVTDN